MSLVSRGLRPLNNTLPHLISALSSSSVRRLSQASTHVRVVETVLRDGIQNAFVEASGNRIPLVLDIESKKAIYTKSVAAGFKHIEMGSVTKLETMSNTLPFYRAIEAVEGIVNIVLIPNERAALLLSKEVTRPSKAMMAIFTASSETFSQKNIACSVEESFVRFAPVVSTARKLQVTVRGYLSCLTACPFEGPIARERSLEVAQRLNELCDVVVPSDTTGAASAEDIDTFLRAYKERVGIEGINKLALHLHGNDLSRVEVALAHGVREFDVALGGIGGCPVVTKAKGNLPAIDFLNYVHARGFTTSIDVDKARQAQEELLSRLESARVTVLKNLGSTPKHPLVTVKKEPGASLLVAQTKPSLSALLS